jgi:hypothetical protein
MEMGNMEYGIWNMCYGGKEGEGGRGETSTQKAFKIPGWALLKWEMTFRTFVQKLLNGYDGRTVSLRRFVGTTLCLED